MYSDASGRTPVDSSLTMTREMEKRPSVRSGDPESADGETALIDVAAEKSYGEYRYMVALKLKHAI